MSDKIQFGKVEAEGFTRHLVGLFFNLLLTLLFNKGNVREGVEFRLLTHNLFITFKGRQKLPSVCIIKLCHRKVRVDTNIYITEW